MSFTGPERGYIEKNAGIGVNIVSFTDFYSGIPGLLLRAFQKDRIVHHVYPPRGNFSLKQSPFPPVRVNENGADDAHRPVMQGEEHLPCPQGAHHGNIGKSLLDESRVGIGRATHAKDDRWRELPDATHQSGRPKGNSRIKGLEHFDVCSLQIFLSRQVTSWSKSKEDGFMTLLMEGPGKENALTLSSTNA